MRSARFLIYFLRREATYHKLSYGKIHRYDGAGALLGSVIGLMSGYLALNILGSGGANISDLTLVLWYTLVVSTSLLGLIRVVSPKFRSRVGRASTFLAGVLLVVTIIGSLVS